MAEPADIEGLFAETVERFGKIDILVNNVGLCALQLVVDITLEEWKRILPHQPGLSEMSCGVVHGGPEGLRC